MERLNTLMQDEPVRLTGWYALVVGLLIEAGLLWALDTPTKAIIAAALTTVATRVGGIEWARRHAYAPSTVEEIRRAQTTTPDPTDEPPQI